MGRVNQVFSPELSVIRKAHSSIYEADFTHSCSLSRNLVKSWIFLPQQSQFMDHFSGSDRKLRLAMAM